MANREECLSCKDYREETGFCTSKWVVPVFDGTPCKQPPAVEEQEAAASAEVDPTDCVQPEYSSPRSKHRLLGVVFFVLVVLLGLWLAYSYWARQKAEEEREDAVWMARIELKVLQSDKSIAYLRLKEMKYEDNLLKLYFTSWPTSYDDNPEELMNDFTSLLTMNPDMWRKVSDYLQQAAVNLQISCPAGLPIMIGNAQLDSLLDNEKLMERGQQVFVEKKKQEVLMYAKAHFRGDPLFRVEEVKSDDRFVTLRLSYDDSTAYLGKTYTDKARVNAHFTDAVGDMGSILDGMLTICTRTNTGFAFEYTGRKKHTRTRLEWSADKARELQKEISERYWHKERKTNQVRTIVVKEQRAK